MIFVLFKDKTKRKKIKEKNELQKLIKKRIVANLSKYCARTAA